MKVGVIFNKRGGIFHQPQQYRYDLKTATAVNKITTAALIRVSMQFDPKLGVDKYRSCNIEVANPFFSCRNFQSNGAKWRSLKIWLLNTTKVTFIVITKVSDFAIQLHLIGNFYKLAHLKISTFYKWKDLPIFSSHSLYLGQFCFKT